MSAPDLRPYADLDALAIAAAGHIAALLRAAPDERPLSLCLAGGSTPAPVYEHLGTTLRDQIPWPRVHLFWGDERFVSHADADSNCRLAHEHLIAHLDLPDEQIHSMPTDGRPDEAARRYESELRDFFGEDAPLFDVMLLGMGDDGHCASLFPGSPVLRETSAWVRTVTAPSYMEVPTRLTLTPPCLNASRHVVFMTAGVAKHPALLRVLHPSRDERLPAAAVHGRESTAWYVDHAVVHGSQAPRRS